MNIDSESMRARSPREAEELRGDLRDDGDQTTASYPLSHGQKALWFLHQVDPTSAAYNEVLALRIRAGVNLPALQAAFQALIDRHPSLRTTYSSRAGEPWQHVNARHPVVFELVDASTWTEEELHLRLSEEARRPFDLEHGPVIRLALFSQAPHDHILVMTLHHIAADLWSVVVLLGEFQGLYGALEVGAHVSLPAPGCQYQEFVDWQSRLLAGPEGERLWNYWRQQLAGDLPVLNLPTDRPRPPVQTGQGAALPVTIPADLTRRLKALGRGERATLYTTLLAAFQTLLYRYSGQEDFLVGSVTAGRGLAGSEGTVGLCANPIALRARPAADLSFKAFLRQVRDTVESGLQHQSYPFSLLIERLLPNRDPSRSPLCDVTFLLQRLPPMDFDRMERRWSDQFGLSFSEDRVSRDARSAAVLEPFALEHPIAKFDLMLELFKTGGALNGSLRYSTDLFDSSTIARMLGHFQTLLQGIVDDPEKRLAELPMITGQERRQLVDEWNATRTDYPAQTCIHELFEAWAERTPEATAVVWHDQELSYRDLDSQADRLAGRLRGLGVGPDVLVGVWLERTPAVVVGLLAILKAGGAYLPLDVHYPQDRLAFMLNDAGIRVLLTQQSLVGALPPHQARVLCVDLEETVAPAASEIMPAHRVTPDNLAYVIYTSGSTGTPKGVVLRHRPVVNLIDWVNKTFHVGPGERLLFVTSLCFDLSVYDIFGILGAGASLQLVDEDDLRDPERLLHYLCDGTITFWDSAPAMLQQLAPLFPGPKSGASESLRRLRLVFLSGDWIPVPLPDLLRSTFPNVQVVGLGGATEAAIWSNFYPIGAVDPGWPSIPYGKPIQNARYHILDRHLNLVPIGVVGELHIGGLCLADGYLARPELTASRFIADPFAQEPGGRLYKTGDLARWMPDGNIEFLGRIDHQVKIRGFRVELGEVETVLGEHPGVRQALVLASDDPGGGKRLVAYVVGKPESPPVSADLRNFLKARLPEYMVPAVFVTLDHLPLTPNGKVDRKALPAPEASRSQSVASLELPRNAIEMEVAAIWEKALRLDRVGIHDNFFEVGGHSLLAAQVISRLQQAFHVELPVRRLFEAPTVAALAAAIARQQAEGRRVAPVWSPLVAMQPNGWKQPLFFAHPVGGNVLCYGALARLLGKDRPFYGLQALGLEENQTPLSSIEDMAAHYVEAIRAVQPEGPYWLGGWSMGGVIAFEMARQLLCQDEKIEFLALVDAHLLTVGEIDRTDAATLAAHFAMDLGLAPDQAALLREQLAVLDAEGQLAYLLEHAKAAHVVASDEDLSRFRRLRSVFQANLRALASYRPEALEAPLTLLRASETLPAGSSDETADWGRLATPFEVQWVPGNHYTMLREPHVRAVAQRLRASLNGNSVSGALLANLADRRQVEAVDDH